MSPTPSPSISDHSLISAGKISKKSAIPSVSEEQIIYALKQAESGVKITYICRKVGVSTNTFYLWKKKYASLGVQEMKRIKVLQQENDRLKKLVAELTLDKHILQEVVEKKL